MKKMFNDMERDRDYIVPLCEPFQMAPASILCLSATIPDVNEEDGDWS